LGVISAVPNLIGMKYIYLISIFFHPLIYAQVKPGPRSVALGSAGTALQDVWSLQQNAAGLAGISHAIIALGYESHFINPELTTQTAILGLPIRNYVVGLSFQRFGIAEYREQNSGLALTKRFSTELAISLALKYHQISIPVYGSAHSFSMDAGIQYQLNERVRFGSSIINPGRSKINGFSDFQLPSSIAVGVGIELSDKVLIASDIDKILGIGVNVRLGMEYQIIQWFYLRGGIASSPYKQSFGFGFKYAKVVLDAAVSSHPKLGYSPNLSVGYEF